MKKLTAVICTAIALTGCATVKPAPPSMTIAPSVTMPSQARSVYFDFDHSMLKDGNFDTILSHADYLLLHPQTAVKLQGNTDEIGSREYNLALGIRRAAEARRLLVILGVKPAAIESVSMGEDNPVAACHNESCWRLNRRVDIVYEDERNAARTSHDQ